MEAVLASPELSRCDRPVRLAYCVDTMHVGGTELNALRTAERLNREQFTITVLSLQPAGPLARRYEAAGIEVIGFSLTSLYAPRTLARGLQLAKLLRQRQIDILHCHDLYANLFAAPWGRAAGLRAVITSRRWIHPLRNRQLEIANRCVNRVGHWVWVNSSAVGDDVTREGVAARRILCVPNFVDEGAFTDLPLPFKLRLRADLGIPREAQIIGCVARLAAVKDHATLLRAMQPVCQRRPTAHLVLVGGGETREQLEALASTLGISDRVHFAGMQPNEPNLHHLFDISTLTSVGEGFPNTLVEAMAAGRPVVATRVGGNVDAVRPDTGILVEARNPEQLTRAFETLLADTALRRRLGQAAQQRARREYHSNSIIPRIEQTYTRLAGLAV